MSTIDEATVRKIAKLSRLNLTDADVHTFYGQLDRILEYVRQLDQVNVQDVEPLAHALPVANVFRDDVPRETFDADAALANSPQTERQFFRVPKVLDQGSGA